MSHHRAEAAICKKGGAPLASHRPTLAMPQKVSKKLRAWPVDLEAFLLAAVQVKRRTDHVRRDVNLQQQRIRPTALDDEPLLADRVLQPTSSHAPPRARNS